MKIWKRFVLWIAQGELLDEYLKGWKAGVNQQKFESHSAEHGWLTPEQYWGPDMGHMYEEVE